MAKKINDRKTGEIGRCCAVCGYGQSQKRGGLMGATSILRAAGYEVPRNVVDEIDRGEKMLFAHLKCLETAKKAAAFEARMAQRIW